MGQVASHAPSSSNPLGVMIVSEVFPRECLVSRETKQAACGILASIEARIGTSPKLRFLVMRVSSRSTESAGSETGRVGGVGR
jgi:hypothetical protein